MAAASNREPATVPSDREDREIEKAIDLYEEFLAEYPGGNI
jgi:hypothetical protein